MFLCYLARGESIIGFEAPTFEVSELDDEGHLAITISRRSLAVGSITRLVIDPSRRNRYGISANGSFDGSEFGVSYSIFDRSSARDAIWFWLNPSLHDQFSDYYW